MSSLSLPLFRRIIRSLSPQQNNLVGAFAYGSVVFPQHGRPSGNGQIDLVLIVTNPVQWHFSNIQRHPEHYNMLMRTVKHKSYMPFALRAILTGWPGPRVYYNPLVQWHDDQGTGSTLMLKYGVACLDDVISDLNTWSNLYVAGRLHKPVLWLPISDVEHGKTWTGEQSSYAPLDKAQKANLLAALSYVLLTFVPAQHTIPESDLFHALASISYSGDWRMIVGEDRNKVTRLVTGLERVTRFRQLYAPCFSDPSIREFVSFKPLTEAETKDQFALHIIPPRNDPSLIERLLNNLPERLRSIAVQSKSNTKGQWSIHMPTMNTVQTKVKRAVEGTVRRSSIQQTALGVISAGPVRSVLYAAAKLRKMFASLGIVKWS
ncbi:unnamed protein product [Echinostoma caproni]|uniref:Phosphatidate cytidylyltransferase, mitochondrial n=1 Tax=Echinostoma caproni TaxID=27848 RepID=A0A183AIH7_9TREM|nr:unnamed protein product [Echinostoma caproni]